jgi:hypothetical protein
VELEKALKVSKLGSSIEICIFLKQ